MTTVTPLAVDCHCPRCGLSWPASIGKPLRHQCVESDPVVAVWQAYTASLAGSSRRPRLTDTRRALIARRLAQYPLDDVVAAVQGWQFSPFHCGDNDEGRAWNDLETILAVSSKRNNLERFRDLWQDFAATPLALSEIDFTHVAEPGINSERFMTR